MSAKDLLKRGAQYAVKTSGNLLKGLALASVATSAMAPAFAHGAKLSDDTPVTTTVKAKTYNFAEPTWEKKYETIHTVLKLYTAASMSSMGYYTGTTKPIVPYSSKEFNDPNDGNRFFFADNPGRFPDLKTLFDASNNETKADILAIIETVHGRIREIAGAICSPVDDGFTWSAYRNANAPANINGIVKKIEDDRDFRNGILDDMKDFYGQMKSSQSDLATALKNEFSAYKKPNQDPFRELNRKMIISFIPDLKLPYISNPPPSPSVG